MDFLPCSSLDGKRVGSRLKLTSSGSAGRSVSMNLKHLVELVIV